MGDRARSADDRLPWLDSPRPARPVPAARRARTPLLLLLALFCFAAIAVMAYLAGRGSPPDATMSEAPVPETAVPDRAPATMPTPVPPAPLDPPPEIVLAPAPTVSPSAPPVAAPVRAAPARPRATRPKAKRKAIVRRSAPRQQAQAPSGAADPRTIELAPPPPSASTAPQARLVWPAQPFAGPRGRVIQLGTYVTPAQADAAWWRIARAYPYLTTLPRMVTWMGPSPGRPRYYRVRLAAGSRREARALCSHLHRIGRGCVVV